MSVIRQFIREALHPQRIEPTRQQTSWTCGPASLKSVVELLKGVEIPEKKLADITNANAKSGTSPEDIVRGCEELKLDAREEKQLTNDQLRKCMQDGSPVILDVDMWDGEHWVVVHACDDKSFTLMDPAVGESLTVDDKALDGMRWDSEKKLTRGGIVISQGPEQRVSARPDQ